MQLLPIPHIVFLPKIYLYIEYAFLFFILPSQTNKRSSISCATLKAFKPHSLHIFLGEAYAMQTPHVRIPAKSLKKVLYY